MDPTPEVIITSSNVCAIYDASVGNTLKTYKEGDIACKTLCLIDEDFLIGAIANQPAMKVWRVSQTEGTHIFPCRGIVTTLAVSSCGTYCVGGIKEEIHVWRVSTGELLNVVNRHYQDITCLRFSSENSHFLSGGKDGHVIVWVLSQVIGVHIERDQVKPRFVWNDHSAEVTDIYVGSLGIESRVATTSLDMTCRLYELDSGVLLSVICMEVALTSVVMDTLEYFVFLGDGNGSIYRINVSDRLPKEIYPNENNQAQFVIHEGKILSLSLSLEGTKIMSASEDKTCKIWDIESMSCLRTIVHEGPITGAFLAMKPTVLSNERVPPQFTIRSFRRNFDEGIRSGAVRKYDETKLLSRPLSLMEEDSSDKCYSSSLLRGPVKFSAEDADASKYYENMFQEAIHKDSINDLKRTNHELYTLLLSRGLEGLFPPPDFE